MYTNSSSFFCGLCKNNKSIQHVRKIIMYDTPENNCYVSDLCAVCFKSLYNITANRDLSEKNQKSLNEWNIEVQK